MLLDRTINIDLFQSSSSQQWNIGMVPTSYSVTARHSSAQSSKRPTRYRHQKEIPSTQLSPVKKRVKESSPPLAILDQANHQGPQPSTAEEAALLHLAEWSASSASSHLRHSHTVLPPATLSSSHDLQSQRSHPFIVIRDTPSPVPSVITISSDSEDEGDGLKSMRHNRRSDHHHQHRQLERHQSDRYLNVVKNVRDERQLAENSARR